MDGDEFVVILATLSASARDAAISTETVAEEFLVSMNQNYVLGSAAHHSTANIGANLFKGLPSPSKI